MSSGARWSDYDRWNEALARKYFGPEFADVPVYIDVDEAVLEACASEAGFDTADAATHLTEVVASTLAFDVDGNPFREHADRFKAWRRSGAHRVHKRSDASAPPPPSVALLTALVITAAQMGKGDGLAANAYYPRLAKLLRVPSTGMNRLRHYFPTTETLWRGLNEFLESNEGQNGLPTAYALGHRYVGIPQSQALLRAHDRSRLPRFFAQYGLSPGSEIVPADMERVLDDWVRQNPPPVSANFRRLWDSPAARERISGIVAVELQHWDGSLPAGEEGERFGGSLRLTALVRQSWGSRSLELSFVAALGGDDAPSELVIASAEGQPYLGVQAVAGSRLAPIPGSRLDPESLTGSVVELRDSSADSSVKRRPRVVVPLRKDDLLGVYVEADRAQLAEDMLVLVKDDPRLVEGVLSILEQFGRHGDVHRPVDGVEAGLAGLPAGWVLIEGAQLLAVPVDVKRTDLQVLVPAATAQLTLAGGLKLPGRIRKWSSLHPPEIRAVVAEAEEISLTLTDLTEDPLLIGQWSSTESALVVPADELDLDDGDYEIALTVNGSPVSVTTLRLRSASTPDLVSWNTCTRLNYEFGSATGALTASEATDEADHVVDGLYAAGKATPPNQVAEAPSAVPWSGKSSRSHAVVPAVVLGAADPESCVVTSKHYMEISQVHDGMRRAGNLDATCKYCGIQKRFPARPRWKKVEQSTTETHHDFSALPTPRESSVSWDACLDALVHVGGGRLSSLERIASQAEGTSLFLDEFVRTLEGLGQIDVRRDLRTFQPLEWEANPAYLAETAGRGFVLAGVWSAEARRDLERALSAAGGELVRETSETHELSAWFARGLSSERLESIVETLDVEVYVVPEAVDRMLDALPPLSEVAAALPRVTLPQYAKASIFDLSSASWVTVPGIGVAGAYRVEQTFRRSTWWIDAEGARERTGQQATIQLVKHLAAHAARRPLLAHLSQSDMLVTPLGADLPGLYGRVAMLCSGLPPAKSTRTRTIGYQNVPQRVATRLHSLLLS